MNGSSRTIRNGECHQIEFKCERIEDAPSIQVLEKSLRITVKLGSADDPLITVISNATISVPRTTYEARGSVKIPTLAEGLELGRKDGVYTLFIKTSSLRSEYVLHQHQSESQQYSAA